MKINTVVGQNLASTAAPLYVLLRIRNRVKTKDAYFVQNYWKQILSFFFSFFDFFGFSFFMIFWIFFGDFFFRIFLFRFFLDFFLFSIFFDWFFFYFFEFFSFLFFWIFHFFHLDLLSIASQTHFHLFIWTYSLLPVKLIFIFSSGLTLYRQSNSFSYLGLPLTASSLYFHIWAYL